MGVSSRRVSCTHRSSGRVSKWSDLPSIGEVMLPGSATGRAAAAGFVPVLAALLGFTAALLVAAVDLASALG
jgi:hypothetical protein